MHGRACCPVSAASTSELSSALVEQMWLAQMAAAEINLLQCPKEGSLQATVLAARASAAAGSNMQAYL